MERYKSVKFAHRGLHDGGRAENSLSAFSAAVAKGYGIELDVRLCKSGELVVFHDPTLNRVCGVDGRVIDMTAEELSRVSLSGTGEGVPTFAKVLQTVGGAVPLLIEIKMEEITFESGDKRDVVVCVDGEIMKDRQFTVKLSDKKVNFFYPGDLSYEQR